MATKKTKPKTASECTKFKHRPIEMPLERQHPYAKTDRNHIFVSMDFNPLTEDQMLKLEKLIRTTYEEMIPHSKKTLSHHTWIRIFP